MWYYYLIVLTTYMLGDEISLEIKELKIGNLSLKIPIVQGGMGVGVSKSKLASAVANMGGLGVISAIQIGYEEEDFETNNDEANVRGLIKEIRKARELSPTGALGINMLSAANNYKEMVLAAVREKIDVIISGAGLPLTLPELVKGSSSKIVPIVSSGKAANLITKSWERKYDYLPDAVIVEGPLAGGHLGFKEGELREKTYMPLEEIVKDVLKALKPFEEKHNRQIPVIAAGGIYTGADIAKFLKLGAAGVQMGTRFVATHECDAHENFKKAYIDSIAEKIGIIKSPLGMPGRAIRNEFIERIEQEKEKIKKCYRCLSACNPAEAPYCISKALINSVTGNIKEGLIFTGETAYRIDKIVSVKELIEELMSELELAMS